MDSTIRDEAEAVIERAREAGREAEELLLTVKEYAGLFRRHPQSVYTAIRNGSLKFPIERPTGGRCVLIRVPVTLIARIALHRDEPHKQTQTNA